MRRIVGFGAACAALKPRARRPEKPAAASLSWLSLGGEHGRGIEPVAGVKAIFSCAARQAASAEVPGWKPL